MVFFVFVLAANADGGGGTKQVIPADPANPDSREVIQAQAGQVRTRDSSGRNRRRKLCCLAPLGR